MKWFIIISLVAGIVKVVCLMIGVIKHPDPENCGLGWNENAMTQYDATHEKRWVRINLGHGRYTESYTNGNLHGLVWFLLLIVFRTLGFMSGIFMPLFIIGNLLIGIISLVLRAVLSSGDNREEAA